MAEIPQYQVDSGDFTPEEILDVIPEQERLDKQVQNDEERYLRQLEQNAEDRIRNTEKMWGGIAKLSGKVGDILQEKRDKHIKEKSAALKNRVLLYGVGENLAAHFSGDKRDLFEESLEIHDVASKIEKTGDLVTAEDYRNMSKWEQYAIQEEYARKKGADYPRFVEEARKTVSIEVTDPDGSVRTVKFGGLNDYQPTATEADALNAKIQAQFAYQLDGIDNEALIAEQVRPHVLQYNKEQRNIQATNRSNARKKIDHDNTLDQMTSILNGGSLEEGFNMYQNYTKMYIRKNGLDPKGGMEQANVQFGLDLVHLVETGKIDQYKAIALIDEQFEFARGPSTIEGGKGLSDIRRDIIAGGTKWAAAKDLQKQQEVDTDVNGLELMGPISDQQATVLTKAFNIKYKGNIPSEIRNKLKGYRPDDEAIADLDTWKRAQGGKLYGYQLRDVSNAVYDKYKDILVGSGGPTENGTSAYKLNQKLFDAKTQQVLKSNYGVGDIKSENFLYLRANVEERYNDAYNTATDAGYDPIAANKQAMDAVEIFLKDGDAVAKAQKPDFSISQQEERYVTDVSTGREQGKNNQWKTSRMSMAGQRADEELLAWSQKTDRRVADMPRYYVDVARQLGIAPETFGLAQAALITQEEPPDEKALAKEMSKDDQFLRGIFNKPNTYSVIQSVMMLEQEGEEVTTDNSFFNNPSVTNEDI